MITPIRTLEYEVPAGSRGDRDTFDRHGCAVGRGLLAPDVVRAVRAPLVEELIADGHVEPVADDQDRLRWVGGDKTGFNRNDYAHHLTERTEELLLKPGLAAAAIEAVWGTPAAIWEGIMLFVALPGSSTSPHRDATPLASSTEASGQVRLWVPLTELGAGEGSLALAVGSHHIPDRPAKGPPLPHVLHPDLVSVYTRNSPPEEQIAPLWRASPLSVGDAIVFRSDVMHTSEANRGAFLRLSLVLSAQDARVPMGHAAGLSLDSTRPLTDLEWVILAILAVQPTSPWRARCACYSRGIVGKMWAEHPSDRVERTFATLEARGLIEPHKIQVESHFWLQRYYHAAPEGRSKVVTWLTTESTSDPRLQALKTLLGDWLELDALSPITTAR